MKNSKTFLAFLVVIVFSLISVAELFGQRNVSYRDLAMRQQQSQASFDYLTLPGNDNELVQFVVIFHLPYSSLPFKKNKDRSSDNKYFSSMDLMMEVFKAEEASIKNKKKENISLEGLEPAGRAFWSDTVYAKDYDSSQSNDLFLSGYMKVNLKPGSYNYVLQMKRGDQTENRISRTQKINITPYSEKKNGNILVSPTYSEGSESSRFILNTTGNTVEYAKDFYAIAYLPRYQEKESYTMEITKLSTLREDTTKQERVFSKKLAKENIKTDVRPQLLYMDGKPYLNLNITDNGYTYAVINVPNREFENSLYQITIKDGKGNIVARDNFRSKWKDMPNSLLNLDTAIEMLRFIADKQTIRKIDNGTPEEREQKFRSFWKERDPTPDTEFNELMAEYYRRIDYAYKNFSTENTVGFNSDRGEAYIKFGPPKDINRKFPNNGATTEIWTYPNRQLIFRATTGFGDFKLISNQSK
ncbi:GWxTD domain-containing protein [Fodinibius sp. SL11]|uniref:GWxTD domain-containing protein n=1 Tax=Fodinibius sp. SL11 TaxID=3425690 RepID=UPI003F88326E